MKSETTFHRKEREGSQRKTMDRRLVAPLPPGQRGVAYKFTKTFASHCVLCGSSVISRIKIIALLLALCLAQGVQAADEISSAPLYQASFNDLAGQTVALAQFRGKVLVVNFWATWCPPCRKEIPDLIEVYEHYRERDVAFLGIAVEDNRELVQDFARTYGINYPLVADKALGIELMQQLGNQVAGLPFTLVLDTQGKIVATRRGPMSAIRLEQALQTALASPGQADADTR